MSKQQVKTHLREKAKKLAFYDLCVGIQKSSKAKDLRYAELKVQDYLKCEKVNEREASMLFALRTKCVRGIKDNFKNMFQLCQHCPLQCDKDSPALDTQEHILRCKALGGSDLDLNFMYASPVEQSLLAKTFCKLMSKREQQLEEGVSPTCCGLPGVNLDQRTQPGAAVLYP